LTQHGRKRYALAACQAAPAARDDAKTVIEIRAYFEAFMHRISRKHAYVQSTIGKARDDFIARQLDEIEPYRRMFVNETAEFLGQELGHGRRVGTDTNSSGFASPEAAEVRPHPIAFV
jgi:hypothetical protein